MKKPDVKEEMAIIAALKSLGGMATISRIKSWIVAQDFNFKVNVRKTLRELKRRKVVKTDRPFAPSSLEMRYELLRQ